MRNFSLPDGEWKLYVLKCEHGYHYVGITTNVERRLTQHGKGKGANVTRLHKPISLLSVHLIGSMSYEEAELYEDAYTLRMATEHKSTKWRGGRFCGHYKLSTAKRTFAEMPSRYKGDLPVVAVDFRFNAANEKKRRRKKRGMSAELKRQIRVAERQNRAAVIHRFGHAI